MQHRNMNDLMPGLRSGESIISWAIRKRDQREAQKAQRIQRLNRILLIANLIAWPAFAWVAIRIVETLG